MLPTHFSFSLTWYTKIKKKIAQLLKNDQREKEKHNKIVKTLTKMKMKTGNLKTKTNSK